MFLLMFKVRQYFKIMAIQLFLSNKFKFLHIYLKTRVL